VTSKKIFLCLFLCVALAGCTPTQNETAQAPATELQITATPDNVVPIMTAQPTPTYYFPVDTPVVYTNPTPDADLADVQVLYVGNSGFLVTIGDQKILIDSLYEGFNGECALTSDVYDLLVAAQPPFDDIDLILATHDHADHFNAETVQQYMRINQTVMFASTRQAAEQLTEFGNRVITLDASQGNPAQVDINGIHVEALYLTHGTVPNGEIETINNGFIVTVGEISFFHTGDIDISLIPAEVFINYGLPGMDIDLLFIPHFLLETSAFQSEIQDAIHSRYIVVSHYLCSDTPSRYLIERHFPGSIFFTAPLQTWGAP